MRAQITIQQTFNRTTRPPEYDELQWAKGQQVLAANTASVGFSLAAGLTIATGTDCPGSCALVGREVEYLVNLHGLDPLEAIKCATANGPLALMVRQENLGMAPLSGQLKEGFVADVIALRSSPLEDIAVLKEADSVTHVWRGGELFKSPELTHICEGSATVEPEVLEAFVPKSPCWM